MKVFANYISSFSNNMRISLSTTAKENVTSLHGRMVNSMHSKYVMNWPTITGHENTMGSLPSKQLSKGKQSSLTTKKSKRTTSTLSLYGNGLFLIDDSLVGVRISWLAANENPATVIHCLIGYKYNKNSVIFHGIYLKKEDSVNYNAILYQESGDPIRFLNLLTLLSPRANTQCIIG